MSWLLRVRDQARDRLAAARHEGLPVVVETSSTAETPGVVVVQARSTSSEHVPTGLRIGASWAWRVIALVGALYVVFWLISLLRVVIIPIAVALLLAALLEPAAGALRRRGAPRSVAAITILVLGLVAVIGVLTLVVQAFIDGLPDLTKQLSQFLDDTKDWLAQGHFGLSQKDVNDQATNLVGKTQTWLSDNSSTLTSGALSTATTLGEVLTGFFLTLFSTFFFLKDGSQIWRFLTRLLPQPARAPVHTAGQYAWHTLTSYVRATVLVAFVDALGIGIGLAVLHIPLALPLAALVFLGAFIPVIGATASGVVAIVVALVTHGPVQALIVLAIVIGVQQLEGHVLQPLIMGRAVALHPLAVILAIAIGIVVAGIVGGLVAVPLLAVINTAVRYLVRRPEGGPAPGGVNAPPGTRPLDDDDAAAEQSREQADQARQETAKSASGSGPVGAPGVVAVGPQSAAVPATLTGSTSTGSTPTGSTSAASTPVEPHPN